MQFVQCENPRCPKRGTKIPMHEANVFQDGEYYKHYACRDPVCLIRAIMTVDLTIVEKETFMKALVDG